MSDHLKIGIVIPNYGRLEYLKEAVDSVLGQSYEHLELVISDDNSPDPAIREYFSQIKDPRVKWVINRTNVGTTKNYDQGVRMLGKDITWALILDNDDVLDKDYIQAMVQAHLKNRQAKVLCGHQTFVNAHKQMIKKDGGYPDHETAQDYLLLRCQGQRDLRSSNVFFDLKRFFEVGGYPQFDSGMGTDTVLIFALAFDNRLAYAPSAKIYIRVHEGAESITTDHLWEKLLSMTQMQNYCLGVYNNHPPCSQQQKEQVLAAFGQHVKSLSSALLVKRYREIVSTLPASVAKKTLQETVERCRKEKIEVTWQYFILFKFFDIFGFNIEELSVYKFLRHCKNNMNINSLRKRMKQIPLALYVYRHWGLIFKLASGSWGVSGWRYCFCCGWYSLFYVDHEYTRILRQIVPQWGMSEEYTEKMVKRENDVCAHCRSNFRTRAQAQTVLNVFHHQTLSSFLSFLRQQPSFIVYETAHYHLFKDARLRKISNYVISEFHSDLPFGQEVKKGVRNENLEALTFPDQSIDVVITSEVLEHVSDLSKALREIHRVLKNDGHHILTIPVDFTLESSVTRAVVGKDGQIKHLYPPAIHGDDITSGILAFRDFGKDIKMIMEEHGFEFLEKQFYFKGEHVSSVYVCKKLNTGICQETKH